MLVIIAIPSGKHTKDYGQSPFLMGKSTINGPVGDPIFTRRSSPIQASFFSTPRTFTSAGFRTPKDLAGNRTPHFGIPVGIPLEKNWVAMDEKTAFFIVMSTLD
jgi:hypothetical protein